jgi:hypothetical protein
LLLGLARAVTLWSKSCRTHGCILLSHLRLSQRGGPDLRIHIPQEQDGPVIPPGTGFPFVASYKSKGYGGGILTRLHTPEVEVEVEINLQPSVSRPVCPGVRGPLGTRDQFFFLLEISFRLLRFFIL